MSDPIARAEALLEQASPHLHELVVAEEHLRALVDEAKRRRMDSIRLDTLDHILRAEHGDVSRNGKGELCVRQHRNDGQAPGEYGDLRYAIDRYMARISKRDARPTEPR